MCTKCNSGHGSNSAMKALVRVDGGKNAVNSFAKENHMGFNKAAKEMALEKLDSIFNQGNKNANKPQNEEGNPQKGAGRPQEDEGGNSPANKGSGGGSPCRSCDGGKQGNGSSEGKDQLKALEAFAKAIDPNYKEDIQQLENQGISKEEALEEIIKGAFNKADQETKGGSQNGSQGIDCTKNPDCPACRQKALRLQA